MAGDNTDRASDEREKRIDARPGPRLPQQSGPPLFSDGPELLRDNHC